MKKLIIIVVIMISSHMVYSQSGSNKVEQLKRDFITKELSLSQQEADKFFPIYDEYMLEKRTARKSLRQEIDGNNSNSLDRIIDKEQAIVDVQKEYYEKFKSVLPESKVIKLIEAEKKFKAMLMKRLQEGK